MSKSYKECCLEVNLDPEIKVPEQSIMWYAYEGGQVIKCETQQEAKKYKLYEKVLDTDSKQRVNEYWEDRRVKEAKAAELFRIYLRDDYPEMSDDLFDLCYNAADDTKRSADYEEIPDLLKYFALFAQKTINLSKKEDVSTDSLEVVEESRDEEVVEEETQRFE